MNATADSGENLELPGPGAPDLPLSAPVAATVLPARELSAHFRDPDDRPPFRDPDDRPRSGEPDDRPRSADPDDRPRPTSRPRLGRPGMVPGRERTRPPLPRPRRGGPPPGPGMIPRRTRRRAEPRPLTGRQPTRLRIQSVSRFARTWMRCGSGRPVPRPGWRPARTTADCSTGTA